MFWLGTPKYSLITFHHSSNMGGKSSTQRERFLRLLDNWYCAMWKCPMFDVSDREFFIHQIAANLPQNATEMINFHKTYEIRKIRFFLRKTMDSSGRKLQFSSKLP